MENINEKSMKIYKSIQDYANKVNTYCEENNKEKNYNHRFWFPSYDKLSEKFNISTKEIRKCLQYLVEKKLLIQNGSHYYLKEIYDKKLKFNKPVIKKETILLKKVYNYIYNYNFFNFFIKVIVIVICMPIFFVGKKAAELSYYFSKFWFSQILDSDVAHKIAIIFTVFAIISKIINFLLKQEKKENKRFRWNISTWFLILFWITIFSSISFTIFGQIKFTYEKEDKLLNENIEENSDINLYENYNEEKNRLKKEYNYYINEREKIIEKLDKLNEDITSDRRKIKNLNIDKKKVNNEIKLKLIEIKKQDKFLNSQYKQNKKISKLEKPDIFVWFSGLLGYKISAKWIQFLMYLFPAVFIDLIYPFCFNVIFILLFKYIIIKKEIENDTKRRVN